MNNSNYVAPNATGIHSVTAKPYSLYQCISPLSPAFLSIIIQNEKKCHALY